MLRRKFKRDDSKLLDDTEVLKTSLNTERKSKKKKICLLAKKTK